MTRVEFLEGVLQNETLDKDGLEQLANRLSTDCSHFFREAGNKNPNDFTAMFRGFKHFNKPLDTKIRRKDRKPSDTPLKIHNAVDEMFRHRFGWPARSSGVFVTGNTNLAEYYGSVGIVIPIGKFQYVWSGSVEDLYMDLVDGRDVFSSNDSAILDKIDNLVYESYTDKNLQAAILSGHEIMLDCDSYYVLSPQTYQGLIGF
jgi:hypothetical protein